MIVQHFLRWVDTARVDERAAAANALARAYITSEMTFEDRCAAEAALTMLLDDPSPKVRAAMAEPLSMSHRAPIQIITSLAADQPEVSACILVRSSLLSDGELVDRVATGNKVIQSFIARRARVSMQLAAAIAEVGAPEACIDLLENPGAEIAVLSFERLAERFGSHAGVRGALLADSRLPAGTRHELVVSLSQVLRELPLVVASIGEARAERMVRDACIKASMSLIDRTQAEEHGALIEHLRVRGDLTTAFLVRVVACGKIDFFGKVLETLSGQKSKRICALLTDGREMALSAVLRSAGLPDNLTRVTIKAIHIWRDVANGKRVAGVQEVTWSMLQVLNAAPGQSGPVSQDRELADLLRSIHIDELRANAKGHALSIAAA